MSLDQKVAEQFLKPILVGISGYLGANLLGQTGRAILFGMDLDMPLFFGAAAAGSSVLTSSVKLWLLPKISGQQYRESETEALLVAPVLSGLILGSSVYALSRTGFKEGALIGAGSEISGQYAFGIIRPYL